MKRSMICIAMLIVSSTSVRAFANPSVDLDAVAAQRTELAASRRSADEAEVQKNRKTQEKKLEEAGEVYRKAGALAYAARHGGLQTVKYNSEYVQILTKSDLYCSISMADPAGQDYSYEDGNRDLNADCTDRSGHTYEEMFKNLRGKFVSEEFDKE